MARNNNSSDKNLRNRMDEQKQKDTSSKSGKEANRQGTGNEFGSQESRRNSQRGEVSGENRRT